MVLPRCRWLLRLGVCWDLSSSVTSGIKAWRLSAREPACSVGCGEAVASRSLGALACRLARGDGPVAALTLVSREWDELRRGHSWAGQLSSGSDLTNICALSIPDSPCGMGTGPCTPC